MDDSSDDDNFQPTRAAAAAVTGGTLPTSAFLDDSSDEELPIPPRKQQLSSKKKKKRMVKTPMLDMLAAMRKEVETIKTQLATQNTTIAAQKRKLDHQERSIADLKRDKKSSTSRKTNVVLGNVQPPVPVASVAPVVSMASAVSMAMPPLLPPQPPLQHPLLPPLFQLPPPPLPQQPPPLPLPPQPPLLQQPPPPPPRQDHEKEIDNDDDDIGEDGSVFSTYIPFMNGSAHPTLLATPTALHFEPTSEYKEEMQIYVDASILANPALSAPQLDAVALSRKRNAVDGFGFQVGDAVGVGKTRIALAFLKNNHLFDGKSKTIFISVGSLFDDIVRDSKAAGLNFVFYNGTKMAVKKVCNIPRSTEILFISHDGLKGFDVDELLDWAFETKNGGLELAEPKKPSLLVDESHKVVKCSGSGKSVRAVATYNLLNRGFERGAFVMTLSGTFACKVADLELNAGILGLCKTLKTPELCSFDRLKRTCRRLGSCGLEAICGQLRSSGSYCSRSLSMDGVVSSSVDVEISNDDEAVYGRAALLWAEIHEIPGAFVTMHQGAAFYGASLRFFRALLMSLKTEAAIELACAELDSGRSPIISVISTDEASLNRNKSNWSVDDDDDDSADTLSETEEINRLEHGALHDAITMILDYAATNVDSETANEQIAELRLRGSALPLEKVSSIDRLKHALAVKLGNDRSKVVELTGRKSFCELPFGNDTADLEKWAVVKRDLSLQDSKDAFQTGIAYAAILSAAASTGVSLHHATVDARPRTLISLELPWSATSFVQCCGRTHRSNQLSLPTVKMLVCSSVVAEQRFSSTVQKRMQDLGATTAADSRADGVVAFEDVNLASPSADRAAEQVAINRELALGKNVTSTRLMNRCLAKPIAIANDIMNELIKETAATEHMDRLLGRGVRTIKEVKIGGNVSILDIVDRGTSGSKILTLGIDCGVCFEDACSRAPTWTFYRKTNQSADFTTSSTSQVVLAKRTQIVHMLRPNGGHSELFSAVFDANYEAIDSAEAGEQWEFFYNRSETTCSHPIKCVKKGCDFGLRVKKQFAMTFPAMDFLTSSQVDKVSLIRLTHDGKSSLAVMLNKFVAVTHLRKMKSDATAAAAAAAAAGATAAAAAAAAAAAGGAAAAADAAAGAAAAAADAGGGSSSADATDAGAAAAAAATAD